MNPPLLLSSTVVRDPRIVFSDMDGETVMMSVEQGEYFGLSGIGPFLWEHLGEPVSIEALCRLVQREFDVDRATCEADVVEFVAGLLEHGVARRAD